MRKTMMLAIGVEARRCLRSIPADYAATKPAPLFVMLHYAGEVTPFYGQEMFDDFGEPAFRALHPILIAPDSLGVTGPSHRIHSHDDQILPIAPVSAHVDKLKARGARIEWRSLRRRRGLPSCGAANHHGCLDRELFPRPDGRRRRILAPVKTRVAVALVLAMTGSAAAEGERTPMVGAALTFSDAPDRAAELVGGQLELAWWAGRFGLAAEAAVRRGITDDSARNLAVAGSARLLLVDWMWPSLLEPRDVEAGVELQVIAERTWWSRDDSSDAIGIGAALRLRGGSDWDLSSLLAESRLFLRVMKSREQTMDIIARTSAPIEQPERRGITVLVGLGVAFGSGKPDYLERFRVRWPRSLRADR
jgi:hypothetical protein